jgi:hypothetical protein
VVFLEQDVDNSIGGRQDRWWAGYGGSGTVYLPIVMVDSGHHVRSGSEDYHTAYGAMVDNALDRPAGARLEVDRQQVGDSYIFEVQLTNLSGMTLNSSSGATLYAVVYQDISKAVSNRYVTAVESIPIPELEDGETQTFSIEMTPDGGIWPSMRTVVFAECQPAGTSGPWDMLQAAVQD